MTGVQTCALPICFPVTIDGVDVHFLFSEESTLHYTHSLENIKLIVMRTYFLLMIGLCILRSSWLSVWILFSLGWSEQSRD